MVKIPRRYQKTLAVYRRFSADVCSPGYLHFDRTAQEQVFVWESLGRAKFFALFGVREIDARNGYEHGKRWMDITVAAWKEDIAAGLLFRSEIDPEMERVL